MYAVIWKLEYARAVIQGRCVRERDLRDQATYFLYIRQGRGYQVELVCSVAFRGKHRKVSCGLLLTKWCIAD